MGEESMNGVMVGELSGKEITENGLLYTVTLNDGEYKAIATRDEERFLDAHKIGDSVVLILECTKMVGAIPIVQKRLLLNPSTVGNKIIDLDGTISTKKAAI